MTSEPGEASGLSALDHAFRSPTHNRSMDSARRAVWIAMSDLFLDTDVRLFYAHIARVRADSPFSLVELEKIFREEVAPVLEPNLRSVAGEWAGFGEEWLADAIANRKPGVACTESLAMNDYRAVAGLIERLRAQ